MWCGVLQYICARAYERMKLRRKLTKLRERPVPRQIIKTLKLRLIYKESDALAFGYIISRERVARTVKVHSILSRAREINFIILPLKVIISLYYILCHQELFPPKAPLLLLFFFFFSTIFFSFLFTHFLNCYHFVLYKNKKKINSIFKYQRMNQSEKK